jgi:hypothetical protein
MNFLEFIKLDSEIPMQGILRYSNVAGGSRPQAAVYLPKEFGRYYHSMIPKELDVNPQAYDPHITVVRTGVEFPPNMDAWGKYEGEKVDFVYDPAHKTDGLYWFLNVESDRIGDIREELGLPRYRKDNKGYHITIGNTKHHGL